MPVDETRSVWCGFRGSTVESAPPGADTDAIEASPRFTRSNATLPVGADAVERMTAVSLEQPTTWGATGPPRTSVRVTLGDGVVDATAIFATPARTPTARCVGRPHH